MKKIMIAVLAIMLPVILAACNSESQASGLSPCLKNNYTEIFTYDVSENGIKSGTMTMTFETLTGKSSYTVDIYGGGEKTFALGGQPHMLVSTIMKTSNGSINSVVLIKSSLLNLPQPAVGSYKEILDKDGGLVYMVLYAYDGGYCNYEYNDGSGVMSGRLNMKSAVTYDNEMILIVMRCAQDASLKQNFSYVFKVPSAINKKLESVAIKSAAVTEEQKALKSFITDKNVMVYYYNIALDQRLSGSPVKVAFAPEYKEDGYTYKNLPVSYIQTTIVGGKEYKTVYALSSVDRTFLDS